MIVRKKRTLVTLILLAFAAMVTGGCLQNLALVTGDEETNLQSGQLLITVRDAVTQDDIDATAHINDRTIAISNGAGRSDPMPYGKYTLTIQAAGYENWEGEIDLRSESLAVEIALVPVGTPDKPSTPPDTEPPGDSNGTDEDRFGIIAGRVVDRDSQIYIWDAEVRLNGKKIATDQGRFYIPAAKYGSYTLTVSMPHYQPYSRTFVLDKPRLDIEVELASIWDRKQRRELAMLVMAEAEGEPLIGKVAVAASVLNRVDSPRYPNTIHDVIFQVVRGSDGRYYYQYSPVLDGRIWNEPNDESILATNLALAGWDPSLGATGFYNPAKTGNQWVRNQPVTVMIGNHVFFK